MYKFLISLVSCVLVLNCSSIGTKNSEGIDLKIDSLTQLVIKCRYCAGYDGAGGPCDSGGGGAISKTSGGSCYDGPGGPLYSGPGAKLSIHPGGMCSESPGGNCEKGPGGNGKKCSLACRLNRK